MTMQDSLLERALRDRREAIKRAERAEAALAEARKLDRDRLLRALRYWDVRLTEVSAAIIADAYEADRP